MKDSRTSSGVCVPALCWSFLLGVLALQGCSSNKGPDATGDAGGRPTFQGASTPGARPHGDPTFARDIAPIVYARCFGCHRDGATAPFELRTYDDVASRAEQIADVVGSRYMPPWKPTPGYVDLKHDIGLSDDQIAVFQAWAEKGAAAGDLSAAPSPPHMVDGWQLGEPDLVIAMREPYEMYAEGPDVYRSFAVVPELEEPVWVEAVEFDPGNYRIAHHAFFTIDRTGRAIDLDAAEAETGFAGMSDLEASAQKPIDQFLSWQVGRQPDDPQPGVAWRLNPGDVIVFEMHLIATGKPEKLQAAMGLHFADKPPTKQPVMVAFVGQEIDIPAGESEYIVTNEYRLPIEATVTGILPHAHYLGKQTHAWATLPDGSREWLIRIDDWDLNWQSAYYYEQPIRLPAGSIITQHFVFDNSAANPRNPFSPPRRVQYGREATDEMAELHVQFMFDSPEQAALLRRDSDAWRIRLRGERFARALARNPDDAAAHLEIGKVDLALGRIDAAQQRFEKALEIDFDLAEAHYFLGYLLMQRKDYVTARVRFTYAVSLDPSDFRSQCGIAKTYFEEGNYSAAGHEYAKALNLNDDDPIAHLGFANTLAKVGQYDQAARHFREVYRLDPENKSALYAAQTIEAELKRRSRP